MTLSHRRLRAALATLTAFAALVAVAVASGPTVATPPGPAPARAALVTSTPAAGAVRLVAGVPVAARRHATGPFEAQAEVLRLAAQGYSVVAGEGPAARAAVAQARAAGAFPATCFVAVSPRP